MPDYVIALQWRNLDRLCEYISCLWFRDIYNLSVYLFTYLPISLCHDLPLESKCTSHTVQWSNEEVETLICNWCHWLTVLIFLFCKSGLRICISSISSGSQGIQWPRYFGNPGEPYSVLFHPTKDSQCATLYKLGISCTMLRRPFWYDDWVRCFDHIVENLSCFQLPASQAFAANRLPCLPRGTFHQAGVVYQNPLPCILYLEWKKKVSFTVYHRDERFGNCTVLGVTELGMQVQKYIIYF